MFRLTKEFRFEASHQLKHHDGKCARLHGHSWIGSITVEGVKLWNIGPESKMLTDYANLSKLLEPLLLIYLDHHHLNETLETDSPTSEFIAKWIYDKLEPKCSLKLVEVAIKETCTSSCIYRPNEKSWYGFTD